jgi:predicted HicB family RNase H-like nuclease
MKNIITYKEYSGIVEFEEKKRELYAKVVGTNVSLTCSGSSADELIAAFQQTIDAYLNECHEKKIEPEHPFKGSFNVRDISQHP